MTAQARALLALLVLCVLPWHADAASSASAQYTVAGRVLEARLDMAHEGPAAATHRSRADADRDGAVNASEAAAYGQRLTSANSALPAVSLPTGVVRFDGMAHNSTRVTAITLHGLEGNVSAAAPVVERWDLELAFPGGQPPLEVRFEPGNSSRAGQIRMQVDQLVVHVGPGRVVAAAGGLPLYAKVSDDKRAVQFPGGLGGNDVILVLEQAPEETRGIPWPAVQLAAVALAAAARRKAGLGASRAFQGS